MRILGVHDGVNASACLLEDGVLRYALQEERFSGIKEHVGLPWRSIARLYRLAGISPGVIDEIALSTDYVLRGVEGEQPDMTAQRYRLRDLSMTLFTLWEDGIPVIKSKIPAAFAGVSSRRNMARLAALRQVANFYDGPITIVDHHIAHGAAALYSAPFREPVLMLTKDAAGDGLCATVSVADASTGVIKRIAQTIHTHSYGYLYSFVTKHMGMKPHSHEFKVTGLAPHGSPERGQRAYDTFQSYIGLGKDALTWQRKIPEPLHSILPRLKDDLQGQRFDNIAWGLQTYLEDLMVAWVRNAVLKTGIHKVVAGGGVFMNVKVNKRIREMDGLVDAFFPMPSAGDESTSIGAAQWLYAERMREQGSEPRIAPLGPLYLGDESTDREIEDALTLWWMADSEIPPDYVSHDDWMPQWDYVHSSHVDDLAADLILKGEIVARCRGPMEFGARALGNRSILCDATDLKVVREINTAIKSRDFWMPFAPVVMESRADELLKKPTYAPYMTMAFDTTKAGQHCFRAAMHQADLTVRPQILRHTWNPGYHSILSAYEMGTGCGGMLNTSFNLHGFPIVRDAKDALHVFLNSGLKHMVLGDYLVSKK